MARGSWGFTVVSLAAFSIWAFAGRWFYRNVGEAGLYAVTAIAFLGLTGLMLHRLVQGNRSWIRFQIAFIPAFFAYALVWSGAWFALRFGLGEWLGSFLGSAVFAFWVSWNLGAACAALRSGPILFVTHSIGYFLGGLATGWLGQESTAQSLTFLTPNQLSVIAKLAWGLFYGLGFGAGIGAVFFLAQKAKTTSAGEPAPVP